MVRFPQFFSHRNRPRNEARSTARASFSLAKWTTTRDEVNRKTTVRWHGETETTYPWGKETDYESLVYDADDAHPEISAVQGEAKSVFELKGRVLTWQGHVVCENRSKELHITNTRGSY